MNPGRLIKKIFSLTLSALAVLIISGFLSLQPISESPAYAQQPSSGCTDITMNAGKTATDSVLVGGIPNSGQVDFSSPSDTTMQACAETPAVNQSALKGWAWNTNLGWMSFYCSGGGSGANLGISCGSISYGATLDTSTGAISGFAWGDNIGWISMSGATYGVKVAVKDGDAGTACPNSKKGDFYGYAWTDTVGWMNFCGAHVDLSALIEIPPTDNGTPTLPGDGTSPTDETVSPEDTAAKEPGQAAMIQGNFSMNIVRTDGLPVKIFDENGNEIDRKIGTSLGDQPQSAREKLYRSLAKNIQNNDGIEIDKKTLTSFYPNTVAGMKEVKNDNSDVNGYLIYYRRGKNSNNKTCSVILNNTGDKYTDKLTVNKNITIVTKGCDIFIDSNVRVADKNSGLGIIALEDLTMTGERKGGNIYVCSRVTDIEANLVTDGSIFSYGQNENECGGDDKSTLIKDNGYPDSGVLSESEIKNLFRHQLAIVGSLISNNTYGGSVSSDSIYILGDGSTTTNQHDARLFDINFLRYSHTQKTGNKPTDVCWNNNNMRLSRYILQELCDNQKIKEKYCSLADQKLANPQVWTDICTENNPNKRSIVNIRYNAPTKDMPIFNGQ